MKALVIDDSSAMRFALRQILEKVGFEVIEAADGRDGLGSLQRNLDCAIAMVDWNMPVMDGLEFVRTVREQPQYASLKLIMVTTEPEPCRQTMAIDSGVDGFVWKPFDRRAVTDQLLVLGFASSGDV